MIALRVNDSFLDLGENIRLKLKLNNPIISQTVVAGEYSFPFRLPATAQNIALLDFGCYLETYPDYPQSKTAWLYIDGLLFGKGVLSIHYQGLPYIDTNLKINSSAIAQYKDVPVNALNWGPDIDISSIQQEVIWKVASMPGGLALLIMDAFFTASGGQTINQALNQIATQVNSNQYNNGSLSVTATVSGDTITFTAGWFGGSPWLFTYWNTSPGTVIVPVNNPYDWQLRNDELKAHVIDTNASTYPQRKYVFFPVLNTQPLGRWWEDANGTTFEPLLAGNGEPYTQYYQNFYEPSSQEWIPEYWADIPGGSIEEKNLGGATPFMYLTAVLDGVFAHAGQYVNGFFHNSFSEMKTVVWSNRLIGDYALTGKTPFNLKDYVPAQTISEFLQIVCETFCVGLHSKDRGVTITFVSLPELLHAEAIDWSSKVNFDYKIYSEPITDGLKFIYEEDDKDLISAEQADKVSDYSFIGFYPDFSSLPEVPGPNDADRLLYAYVLDQCKFFVRVNVSQALALWIWREINSKSLALSFGSDQNKIEIKAADPFEMIKPPDPNTQQPGSETWLVPHFNQTFSSALFSEPHKIRFLNYLGMQPNRAGELYPLGSSDNVDFFDTIVSDHSLRFDQPTGYYNKYWKNWVEFITTARKVEVQINLTMLDLLAIDFSKRIFLHGHYHLIVDVQVDLPLTKPALVTLLRIR